MAERYLEGIAPGFPARRPSGRAVPVQIFYHKKCRVYSGRISVCAPVSTDKLALFDRLKPYTYLPVQTYFNSTIYIESIAFMVDLSALKARIDDCFFTLPKVCLGDFRT